MGKETIIMIDLAIKTMAEYISRHAGSKDIHEVAMALAKLMEARNNEWR